MSTGAITLEAIEQTNSRKSDNFFTRLGKYISEIKTNVMLNGSFAKQEFQQIVNSQLTAITNQNWVFGNKIDTDITDWLNAEYESSWTLFRNQIQSQKQANIIQQNHILNLNFNLKRKQYLGLKSEFISSSSLNVKNENVFADLIYRYTIQKKKIDLEMQVSNIFDTNNFRTIAVNDFSYVATNFILRPRQVLLKIRLSL